MTINIQSNLEGYPLMLIRLFKYELYWTRGSLSETKQWFTFRSDVHTRGADYYLKILGGLLVVSRINKTGKGDRGVS